MIWLASTPIGQAVPADPDQKPDPSGLTERKMIVRENDMKILDDRVDWCVRMGITHLELWVNRGLRYPSHPELEAEGAFSPEEMNAFVRRARTRGVKVFPGVGLAGYSGNYGAVGRMVSTPPYYKLVRDVLKDAYEAFDHPEYINIGMGEETRETRPASRVGELLYHDINFFGKVITKLGARPMMNSDLVWHYGQEYCRRVSRDIVQQNWYYRPDFNPVNIKIFAYNLLDEAGFDQVPLCSAYNQRDYNVKVNRDNIPKTLKYCRETMDPSRLLGYGVTRWNPLSNGGTKQHLEGWRYLDAARRTYYPEEDRRVHAFFAKLNPNLPPRELPPLPKDS